MTWKSNFEKGKEVVLATSSKENIPNANIVISLGFVDDKLLVADCQMSNTIKNLKENQNICVVGGYFRIKGNVEIYSSGKYFDLCVKENSDYKVNNAILITINEVFDLDKVTSVE
ncbi:pyridoxamine 5'-phosphate oxidase family protein [Patescibacteria group bacterium]|nr:pyridoxamine 5'-phosphate oxidase family protein [Patescibacteria group bacterium]